MYPVLTKVQAPDLGPPSCAPWIFPLIPPPTFGNATRFGRPDLGTPSVAGRIFSALPATTTAQKMSSAGHGLDPSPPPPPQPPEWGPSPRPMFWFRSFALIKSIDPISVWQPSSWTFEAPASLGWLQREGITIPQEVAAASQSRLDTPGSVFSAPPSDGTPGVGWIRATLPVATTSQLAGVWSQHSTLDPGMAPWWLPEPGPFDPFVARVAIVPATVVQQAGIWSQRAAMDPWRVLAWPTDTSPTPAWIFATKPAPPAPTAGVRKSPSYMRRLKLLGLREDHGIALQ